MDTNYITNTSVIVENNIFDNYTDIETTNSLLTVFIILQISIFIYIFLKQCFDLRT